jgi:hypothetical protein
VEFIGRADGLAYLTGSGEGSKMEIGKEGYFEIVESRCKALHTHLELPDNDLIGFDESGISGKAKRGKSCSPGSPPQKAAPRNLAGGVHFRRVEQRVCHTLLDYKMKLQA